MANFVEMELNILGARKGISANKSYPKIRMFQVLESESPKYFWFNMH